MYHRNYTSKIINDLDFLKSLVTFLHEQKEIEQLELDVAMQKVRELYEHFLKIKLTSHTPPDEKIEQYSGEEGVFLSEEETIPVLEPVYEPEPETDDIPQTHSSAPKATILAEKISPSSALPINESLAQGRAVNDLSSKIHAAPLESIHSGIGLNDKFQYIRELFKGDANLYNNVLNHLDSIGLDDAIAFIEHNFEWDEKNETAQNFINLLHRRYK